MIDLIILTFIACVFYFGFWCGKTFGNIKAMFKKLGEKISG